MSAKVVRLLEFACMSSAGVKRSMLQIASSPYFL